MVGKAFGWGSVFGGSLRVKPPAHMERPEEPRMADWNAVEHNSMPCGLYRRGHRRTENESQAIDLLKTHRIHPKIAATAPSTRPHERPLRVAQAGPFDPPQANPQMSGLGSPKVSHPLAILQAPLDATAVSWGAFFPGSCREEGHTAPRPRQGGNSRRIAFFSRGIYTRADANRR